MKPSRMSPRDRALIEKEFSRKLSMVMSSNVEQLKRIKHFTQTFMSICNAGGFRCKDGEGGIRVVELKPNDISVVKEQAEEVLDAIKRREKELGVQV